MKFFGYKHKKSQRVYAQMLKCLQDCFEAKYEELQEDTQFLMILKTELQTPYMRTAEHLCQTMRKAILKYPLDEDDEAVESAQAEHVILEKILNNQPLEVE